MGERNNKQFNNKQMSSELFKLSLRDILVGAGLAVAGAVLVTLQGALSSGADVDWNLVLKVAEGAFVSYVLKNFFSDESGKIAGKF